MKTVFTLDHINKVNQDIKGIGIYASKEEAEKAIERAVKLDGFRDCPEGFVIQEIEIDKDLISCED